MGRRQKVRIVNFWTGERNPSRPLALTAATRQYKTPMGSTRGVQRVSEMPEARSTSWPQETSRQTSTV